MRHHNMTAQTNPHWQAHTCPPAVSSWPEGRAGIALHCRAAEASSGGCIASPSLPVPSEQRLCDGKPGCTEESPSAVSHCRGRSRRSWRRHLPLRGLEHRRHLWNQRPRLWMRRDERTHSMPQRGQRSAWHPRSIFMETQLVSKTHASLVAWISSESLHCRCN